MTSPVLTTAAAPGPGIYVQAVVYAQATFEASAQYAIHTLPKGTVHFNARAAYQVRPPTTCFFRVSARYNMAAGTLGVAGVTLPAHAEFGANVAPHGSVTLAVSATYSFAGTEVSTPPPPPAQINIAVTRAATI